MLRLQVVSSDGKVAEWSASAEEWQGCCDSSGYLSARESFASGLQAGDQEDASVQISAGSCSADLALQALKWLVSKAPQSTKGRGSAPDGNPNSSSADASPDAQQSSPTFTIQPSNVSSLLQLADLWQAPRLRAALLHELRHGASFCGGLKKPGPGASTLETVPQVVTLLSSATQVLGDPDGGLAALQADSEAWLAEHAHRAWPCRQFASLDRAVQDRVLRAAVDGLSIHSAFGSLLRCRQLQAALPSGVSWSARVGELAVALRSATLAFIWSHFAAVARSPGLKSDLASPWTAEVLNEVSSYAEEQGTPDDAVRLLVSWPLVSLELTYLREELPHVQAAVTALYEQVRAYVKRSFGAVTRSAAWKALPVAKQQEIMKDLQVVALPLGTPPANGARATTPSNRTPAVAAGRNGAGASGVEGGAPDQQAPASSRPGASLFVVPLDEPRTPDASSSRATLPVKQPLSAASRAAAERRAAAAAAAADGTGAGGSAAGAGNAPAASTSRGTPGSGARNATTGQPNSTRSRAAPSTSPSAAVTPGSNRTPSVPARSSAVRPQSASRAGAREVTGTNHSAASPAAARPMSAVTPMSTAKGAPTPARPASSPGARPTSAGPAASGAVTAGGAGAAKKAPTAGTAGARPTSAGPAAGGAGAAKKATAAGTNGAGKPAGSRPTSAAGASSSARGPFQSPLPVSKATKTAGTGKGGQPSGTSAQGTSTAAPADGVSQPADDAKQPAAAQGMLQDDGSDASRAHAQGDAVPGDGAQTSGHIGTATGAGSTATGHVGTAAGAGSNGKVSHTRSILARVAGRLAELPARQEQPTRSTLIREQGRRNAMVRSLSSVERAAKTAAAAPKRPRPATAGAGKGAALPPSRLVRLGGPLATKLDTASPMTLTLPAAPKSSSRPVAAASTTAAASAAAEGRPAAAKRTAPPTAAGGSAATAPAARPATAGTAGRKPLGSNATARAGAPAAGAARTRPATAPAAKPAPGATAVRSSNQSLKPAAGGMVGYTAGAIGSSSGTAGTTAAAVRSSSQSLESAAGGTAGGNAGRGTQAAPAVHGSATVARSTAPTAKKTAAAAAGAKPLPGKTPAGATASSGAKPVAGKAAAATTVTRSAAPAAKAGVRPASAGGSVFAANKAGVSTKVPSSTSAVATKAGTAGKKAGAAATATGMAVSASPVNVAAQKELPGAGDRSSRDEVLSNVSGEQEAVLQQGLSGAGVHMNTSGTGRATAVAKGEVEQVASAVKAAPAAAPAAGTDERPREQQSEDEQLQEQNADVKEQEQHNEDKELQEQQSIDDGELVEEHRGSHMLTSTCQVSVEAVSQHPADGQLQDLAAEQGAEASQIQRETEGQDSKATASKDDTPELRTPASPPCEAHTSGTDPHTAGTYPNSPIYNGLLASVVSSQPSPISSQVLMTTQQEPEPDKGSEEHERESPPQQGGGKDTPPRRSDGSHSTAVQQDVGLEHCEVQSGHGPVKQGLRNGLIKEAVHEQQEETKQLRQQGQQLSVPGAAGASPHAAVERHQSSSSAQGVQGQLAQGQPHQHPEQAGNTARQGEQGKQTPTQEGRAAGDPASGVTLGRKGDVTRESRQEVPSAGKVAVEEEEEVSEEEEEYGDDEDDGEVDLPGL